MSSSLCSPVPCWWRVFLFLAFPLAAAAALSRRRRTRHARRRQQGADGTGASQGALAVSRRDAGEDQKPSGHGPERRPSFSTRFFKVPPCIILPIATAFCMPRTWTCGRIAEEIGTPFYCYSSATLERHYRVFAEAFADRDALVCYAMKANSNQAVVRTLGELGAGMDIVSEGELRRALAAGRSRPSKSCSRASARPARDGVCARQRHPVLQRGIRTRTRSPVRSGGRQGAAGAPSRSASIRMSTRRPTRKSRPANPKTNSAFPSPAPGMSTRWRQRCPASRSPASTCISAARSSTLSPSTTPPRCWRNWPAT